ncbi:MAG: hypothetical protein HKN79_11370 [Flavobacteriales bacterium]|nr:hypothetical protein [Flavobacteriales bacterium]
MKALILPTIAMILLLTTSCQNGMTGYEGDLFLPQEFSTSCMEELDDRVKEVSADREFALKANGDIIRTNPNGEKYFFKNISSISMLSDPIDGFCVLWLARDLTTNEELTIYLFETSIRMVYDSGEACNYKLSCTSDFEDEISLFLPTDTTID